MGGGDRNRGGITIPVTQEESWSVRPQQWGYGDGRMGDQGQIKGVDERMCLEPSRWMKVKKGMGIS